MALDAFVFNLGFHKQFRFNLRWLLASVIALILISSAEVFAAVAETKDSAESTEKNSEETTAKSTGSPSQGFSVTESASLDKKSAWSAAANTGLSRYLDELATTTLDVGGSLSYRLSDRDSLSARLSYSAPTELVTAYPEEYGISDLELGWARNNLWTHEDFGSLSSAVRWRLPTSELSQRYTRISSFSGGLTLRRPMPVTSALRNLTLMVSGSAAFTPHQYDRRAMGVLNSPLSFVYSGAGTYNIKKIVNVTTSYSMQHRMEYDGYIQDIQTLSFSAVATLPESFSLTGGYQWRDTVLTNDPFLDADKTLAYLELSRAF